MAAYKRRHKQSTALDTSDTLGAWEMLHEDEIASYSVRLREFDLDRRLTAFARRKDTGAFACFDKDASGKTRGVVVLHHDGTERAYDSFTAWFDAAVSGAG